MLNLAANTFYSSSRMLQYSIIRPGIEKFTHRRDNRGFEVIIQSTVGWGEGGG